jgi:hypothetical protein
MTSSDMTLSKPLSDDVDQKGIGGRPVLVEIDDALAGVRCSASEGLVQVVADLASGDAGAIEDALEAAWKLQRTAG